MKKFLALILSLTFCGAFLVGCNKGDNPPSSSSSPNSSSASNSDPFGEVETPDDPEPEEVTYTITYYAVIDGVKSATIPEEMKNTDGKYPTSYVYGAGAVVSALSDTEAYDFIGWYVDEACSIQATLPISAKSAVNQTLYAKIATVAQEPQEPQQPEPPAPVVKTITYYAVINNGTPVEVPDALKTTGGNYPVEYTVGVGATVSVLQDVNEYDFIGWYVNASCDNEFEGTIDTNANGDVVLYAKVQTKANIEYRAVVGKKVKAFNDFDAFKIKDGSYPTEYQYNATTTVSALVELVEYPLKKYEFLGWYLDEACTQPFGGTIDATNPAQRGTVYLYAKLSETRWTIVI